MESETNLTRAWKLKQPVLKWMEMVISTHFPCTPWKFNIAPENGWLEDEFPFGIPYFQGLC